MRIALGTDKGIIILASKDLWDDWKFISHAHQGRKIQCLIGSYNDSILATTAHGAIYKTKDYKNWMTTMEGIEGLNITSIAVHPQNPMIMYAGTTPPNIYYSDSAGLRWQKLNSFTKIPDYYDWTYPEPPYRAKLTSIILHTDFPNVVLASIAKGGFVGSLDSGETWMKRSVNLESEICRLCLNPLMPTRLFAATSTGIYRSCDLGSSWSILKRGLPYSYIRDMAISPDNPNRILACVCRNRKLDSDQSLCISQDGGDTWETKINGINKISSDPIVSLCAANNGSFAIGTQQGDAYITTNNCQFWQRIYSANSPINAILFHN